MIESCIVMFGGFDGEFFNDLNILDLKGIHWEKINIIPSTLNQDLCKLLGEPESYDI